MSARDRRIIVDVASQSASLLKGPEVLKVYSISTGKNGIGCEKGSNCTPPGLLRVAAKIGGGLPYGTVLKGRVPTGETWSDDPRCSLAASGEDLILSRILWLEGLERENANTKERFIYFHGTNQEGLLGQPASHGCIRMSNRDVIELYELVDVGTEVEVKV